MLFKTLPICLLFGVIIYQTTRDRHPWPEPNDGYMVATACYEPKPLTNPRRLDLGVSKVNSGTRLVRLPAVETTQDRGVCVMGEIANLPAKVQEIGVFVEVMQSLERRQRLVATAQQFVDVPVSQTTIRFQVNTPLPVDGSCHLVSYALLFFSDPQATPMEVPLSYIPLNVTQ